MSIRETISQNSVYTTIGAVVVLGISALLFFTNLNGSTGNGLLNDKWMYDLNTNQLVRAEATLMPPAVSDSGTYNYPKMGPSGALVDAMVYSCGDPSAVKSGMTIDELAPVDAYLAYVVRLSPAYIEAVERGETVQRSEVLGEPDGQTWGSKVSELGMGLTIAATQPCPDGSEPILTRP